MRSARLLGAHIILFVLCLVGAAAAAPGHVRADESAPSPAPCTGGEWRQFDFWVGDWDLTWDRGRGTNRITSTMNGCVILEEFDATGPGGNGLKGMSVSTYSPDRRIWKQTWVDNSGAYLDFTGGREGDRMILSRRAEQDGRRFLQRMVWHHITGDAFDWSWERSDDGGKEWKTVWAIHYRRR